MTNSRSPAELLPTVPEKKSRKNGIFVTNEHIENKVLPGEALCTGSPQGMTLTLGPGILRWVLSDEGYIVADLSKL